MLYLKEYDIIRVEKGSIEDGTTIGREYIVKEMDDTIPLIINNSGISITPQHTIYSIVPYEYIKGVVAERFGTKKFNQLVNSIKSGEYEAVLRHEIVDAYCFLNKIKN